MSLVCKKENKSFEILSRFKLIHLIKSLKVSFGFVLAFVICFVYLFSFKGVVVDLKIRNGGEVVYDILKVENVLKNNGVEAGKINTFSAHEIEAFFV